MKKEVWNSGSLICEKYYAGSFVYNNEGIEYILFDEGRLTPKADGTYQYEYFLKDHLGNTRVVFTGQEEGLAVLQESHYYPFGMEFMGTPSTTMNVENFYKYNGKELQDDGFDLDGNGVYESRLLWYYYGARFYDVQLGRFHTQDAFAEKYHTITPYQYGANNPIKNIDINGDSIWVTVHANITNQDGSSGIQTSRYYYGQDKNGNSGFLDASGNLYSGSNTFVNQVSSALEELSSESIGKSLVDDLASSSNNTEIAYGSRNSADEQDGSFIKWNPTKTAGGPDQSGTNTRDAFIGLSHEMAHVQDIWNGTVDRSEWVHGIPRSEIYATHVENQIRSEHGVSLRTHYAFNSNGTPNASTRIINSKGTSLFYTQTNTLNLTPKLILGATPPSAPRIISITSPFKY